MRDSQKASARRLPGWLWPFVLLALPTCGLETGGTGPALVLNKGDSPHTSAIMCDIEKYQGVTRRCATAQDLAIGISLSAAAEALVTGQKSNVGLDYSSAAQAACGAGNPQAIDFQGQFPNGFAACLNCGGVIPSIYADGNAVCEAQCEDSTNYTEGTKPPDIPAFCSANAHVSTNFGVHDCYANACTSGGNSDPNFADPRINPEPVDWSVNPTGVSAAGPNLTRTAATTGTGTSDFNAGAASSQSIAKGDGYVEFEASENNLSHVIGLSTGTGADNNPGLGDINFAISLNLDGRFYILEGGTLVMGPDVNGSFGTYSPGERFRVSLKDHNDGTAQVSYSRITGPCTPGNPCNESVFHTDGGFPAGYPLRVDASFREQNATLANVSIVRIK